MKKTIFLNGNFYTPRVRGQVNAIAVENGVIVDLGSEVKIKPLSRRGYKVVDLKKKTALPGLIDAHLHMLGLGNLFSRVNLDNVDSIDKVESILRKAAVELGKDQWLRGRGWNKNLWGEGFPDKSILDRVTDNPVALNSKDGHLIWVNSTALKLCGITRDTPDPKGGVILKDKSGEPTGILKENAVDLVICKIPQQTYQEKMDALIAAQKHLLSLGITGAGDCDTNPSLISKYLELEKNSKLKLRVYKMIHPDDLENAAKLGMKSGVGSAFFRTGSMKLFADGALGSQTAYMFKPFVRSKGNVGVETLTQKQIEDLVRRALDIGIAPATHAIGDRANYQTLLAYSKYKDEFIKTGLRARIEHAQILRRKELPMFARFGIIASMQPIHTTSDRDISDRYLGARGRYSYPFKTLLKSGAVLAFGSDAPIETADPIAGIHAAVTRKRPIEKRRAWYPEEKLTVNQAIDIYSKGSAYACCFDDIAGEIAVGKRADFAVLSDDILKVKAVDIHKIKIVASAVDGEFVFMDNANRF